MTCQVVAVLVVQGLLDSVMLKFWGRHQKAGITDLLGWISTSLRIHFRQVILSLSVTFIFVFLWFFWQSGEISVFVSEGVAELGPP